MPHCAVFAARVSCGFTIVAELTCKVKAIFVARRLQLVAALGHFVRYFLRHDWRKSVIFAPGMAVFVGMLVSEGFLHFSPD